VIEAAIVDGAGFWRRLFQVELPLLLPVVAVAVLFGVVYTATDLGVVYILTGGGPANTTHVLPTLAFQRGLLGADLGQGAAITVAVAVPAGYSLARLAGRWGERLGMGIFFTYLIPPTLLFVPFARLISLLGLQDSLASLILIYPTMTIPFCTWLVMGFLCSVPWDIEE